MSKFHIEERIWRGTKRRSTMTKPKTREELLDKLDTMLICTIFSIDEEYEESDTGIELKEEIRQAYNQIKSLIQIFYAKDMSKGKIKKDIPIPNLVEWLQGINQAATCREDDYVMKVTTQIIETIQNQPEDGLVCPRCNQIFHDEDINKNSKDYWQCNKCGVIQHAKCRGPVSDENQPEVDEEWIIERAWQLHEKLWDRLKCDKSCSAFNKFKDFIHQLVREIQPQEEMTIKDIQGWADEARERVTNHKDWSHLEDVMKEMLEEVGIKVKDGKQIY